MIETPIHPSIKYWKLDPAYWPEYLPMRVPLDTTMERFTDGVNGRVLFYFNASSATWRGRNYIAVRCLSYPFWTDSRIALGHLDDNWQSVPPEAQYLTLPGRTGYSNAEDPRLFIFRDQLCVVYTTGWKMRMAWIGEDLRVHNACQFQSSNFELAKQEKNWSMFEHDGTLYCIYMQAPHTVLKVKGNLVEKIHEEPWTIPYDAYGSPRGGASPTYHNGHYWHFFHSVSDFYTDEADVSWLKLRRYHVGLAVVEGKPPFKLVAGSRIPIMSAPELPEQNGRPIPSKHAAVYPGSALRNSRNDGWLVTCGYNDQHTYIYDVPDKLIEERMVEA
jgi:predicted GH43/DUF377 family glycosyl hydrolase